MSWRRADKVTFHDVAAYLSEEEWTGLSERQKELYKNVMVEIHNAMIFLGYQIINADTLIRVYKGEEIAIGRSIGLEKGAVVGNSASSCDPAVKADLLCRVKHEEFPCSSDPHGREETEIRSSPSTGDPITSVFMLHDKEEDLPCRKNCPEPERQENVVCSTKPGPAVSPIVISKHEDDRCYSTTNNACGAEICKSPSAEPGPAVSPNVISKHEDDRCYSTTNNAGGAEICKTPSADRGPPVNPDILSEHKDVRCYSETKSGDESGHEVISFRIKEEEDIDGWGFHRANELESSSRVKEDTKDNSETLNMNRKDSWESTQRARFSLKQPQKSNGKQRLFACSDCNKSFFQKKHLTCHQRIHTGERPFSCPECDKSFTQTSHLKSHQRIHTGEKPFSCTECDKSFTQKTQLKSHRMIHTGEKPFSCTECDKSFTQKGTLQQHLRTHGGVHPFACTECEKSFVLKSQLQRHGQVHSKVRPFSCSECGKSFPRNYYLKHHQRSHRGEKPFSCTKCGKRFTLKSALLIHEKIHKGEKPFSCTSVRKALLKRQLFGSI